ncbi:MAG: hypothetical protein G8345_21530 [Magnetococcales bacterium]|nr:hypothetical protein [Magnetococcales bacterium]NGZ29456.1 hypothetical protein [Magnetococcales bacterium]
MVGFIQKLFGHKEEKPAPPVVPPIRVVQNSGHGQATPPVSHPVPPVQRRVANARELQVNDTLRMAICDCAGLSGKRFKVTSVSTYLFSQPSPTFALQGEDGQRYFLSFSNEHDREYVTFIRPLLHREVGKLFHLEDLAQLFEEKEGEFALTRKEELPHLSGWTATDYHLSIDALKGYFFSEDLREKEQEEFQGGEGLDHYLLLDNSQRFTLEVEVYDNGEPEVALGLRLPVNLVEHLRSTS